MSTDARVGAALRCLLELDHQATRSPGGILERRVQVYHGRSADGDGESYALCVGAGPPVYAGDTLLEILEGLAALEQADTED